MLRTLTKMQQKAIDISYPTFFKPNQFTKQAQQIYFHLYQQMSRKIMETKAIKNITFSVPLQWLHLKQDL